MKTRLSRQSTIAMLISSILILGVFVFPLWVISLVAPQYPQGLGLRIHVDRIEGVDQHDLQNINGLNHYIGMHKIEPGAIPELRYMKFFALGMALTAALVALSRRRIVLLIWVILAVGLSGVGMYDFYQWEYRYGHELDPSAAIKVPGMSYQPPMFGSKQMLNFHTTAYPGVGGWMAIAGVGLGVACAGYEIFLRKRRAGRSARTTAPSTVAAPAILLICSAVGALAASGCSKEPAQLAFGTDACAYCSMTISDERHGAAFVSQKGRTYKFDSVECMVESLLPGQKFADVAVYSFHVVDYGQPGVLVDATNASYLISPAVPSPMGANVSAFDARASADQVREARGGDVLDWEKVQDFLRRRANA